MAHLLIMGYIVILLVGVAAAVYTYQVLRRFEQPFLKSLLYYVIVFNLSAFLYLVSGYVWVNLVRHDPTVADPSIERILLLVMLVVQIGLVYTVVRLAAELQERGSLRKIGLVFAVVTVLFLLSFIVAWNLGHHGWSMIVVSLSVAAIVATWLVLAVQERSEFDPNRQKAVQWLAYLMLSGFVPFAVSYFLPNPYGDSVSTVTRLWLNVVPILWLQRFFLPYYGRLSSTDEGVRLDSLVREYNISKREREIMELILEGKSNKEIEGQLFISFNTVKNHIYNLYQKLGVNSRTQLMHLVMTSDHTSSDR
jgi:DNA-binding CsgD family transcriptional regulator